MPSDGERCAFFWRTTLHETHYHNKRESGRKDQNVGVSYVILDRAVHSLTPFEGQLL